MAKKQRQTKAKDQPTASSQAVTPGTLFAEITSDPVDVLLPTLKACYDLSDDSGWIVQVASSCVSFWDLERIFSSLSFWNRDPEKGTPKKEAAWFFRTRWATRRSHEQPPARYLYFMLIETHEGEQWDGWSLKKEAVEAVWLALKGLRDDRRENAVQTNSWRVVVCLTNVKPESGEEITLADLEEAQMWDDLEADDEDWDEDVDDEKPDPKTSWLTIPSDLGDIRDVQDIKQELAKIAQELTLPPAPPAQKRGPGRPAKARKMNLEQVKEKAEAMQGELDPVKQQMVVEFQVWLDWLHQEGACPTFDQNKELVDLVMKKADKNGITLLCLDKKEGQLKPVRLYCEDEPEENAPDWKTGTFRAKLAGGSAIGGGAMFPKLYAALGHYDPFLENSPQNEKSRQK